MSLYSIYRHEQPKGTTSENFSTTNSTIPTLRQQGNPPRFETRAASNEAHPLHACSGGQLMPRFQFIEEIVKVPYQCDRVRITGEDQLAIWADNAEPKLDMCIRTYRSTADHMLGALYAEYQAFPIFTECSCGSRFKAEHCEDICSECTRAGEFRAHLIHKFELAGGL